MASNYYRQVVDAVRRQGFARIRQGKGSHDDMGPSDRGQEDLDTHEAAESSHGQSDTEGRRLAAKGFETSNP